MIMKNTLLTSCTIIYSLSLYIQPMYSWGWGGGGGGNNFWDDLISLPTPRPTPLPTHKPTPPPKKYTWNDNNKHEIRSITANVAGSSYYTDVAYPCDSAWDADARGGWDIYAQYEGVYMYDQFRCERLKSDFYGWYIDVHGTWSGDRVSDPEPRHLSQYFRCTKTSWVRITWHYVACDADHNDFFEMFFNENLKHYVRCPNLGESLDPPGCWQYDHFDVWINDPVNADTPFLVQFKISPTFYDDKLGVGNIKIHCYEVPTPAPTRPPTKRPTPNPTPPPTPRPTPSPSNPTESPTPAPTFPTHDPTNDPTDEPTQTDPPTKSPTKNPTTMPTYDPTYIPTTDPTDDPTFEPTIHPTAPTHNPTESPTAPTNAPSDAPSYSPSRSPSYSPSDAPTYSPSLAPSNAPTHSIQIVDNYWFDDYIYNEKLGEYDNFEIGWTAHNANGSYDDASHMWSGQPLTGSNNARFSHDNIIHVLTSNYTGFPNETFHGPFWSDMMVSHADRPNERQFVTLFRDFECKSQSYVTLWYSMLICDLETTDKIKHSLEIKSWDGLDLLNRTILYNITDTNITDEILSNQIEKYTDNYTDFLPCKRSDAGANIDLEWVHIMWRTNYTAFDDRPWKLALKYQLENDRQWFMVNNFTIYCDLKYPSAAPTEAPSSSPSQPPTLAPSFSPTYSPTTCPDYGYNYTNVDGEDHAMKPYDYVTYATLQTNFSNFTSTASAEFIAQKMNCTNAAGCWFDCKHGVSCLVSEIRCLSDTGCNINCLDQDACGNMKIYADQNPGQSLVIVCDGPASCKNLKVYSSGLAHAELHCMVETACDGAVVYFDNVSIYNNSNTMVGCYAHEACKGLTIYADGKYTRLRMYEFSSGIAIENGDGYFASLETVTCGLDMKYIKWDPTVGFGNKTLEGLIAREWQDSVLPCSEVRVFCDRDNATKAATWKNNDPANTYCQMEYYLKAVDVDTQKPKFQNARCVYVWLESLVEMRCRKDGAYPCRGDATKSPTPSPTNHPTFTPSMAPTFSPTFSPSLAPSFSPSLAPSLAPSIAPSLAPSITPSIAPSIAPSLAPSSTPTQPPTLAPSYSPTQAPTRTPTVTGNIYDTKLDLVYIFGNFTLENYQWLLGLANDSATTHDAVYKLSEFVERQYFDQQYLPSFTLYHLYFERINGEALNAMDMDILLHKIKKPYPEMHAKAVIEFKRTYENWIVKGTSRDTKWAAGVSTLLKTYMNNENATFSVGNYSTLAAEYDTAKPPPDYGFYAINIFLGLCILVAIIAAIHNKGKWGKNSTRGCFPVDNGYWIALIVFGLQIYDMVSDINLTTEIFGAISNRECTIITGYTVPCAQDGNICTDPNSLAGCEDDPESTDTFQEYSLLVAGILSLTFLVLPYGLNIAYAARVPSSQAIRANPSARKWFETYQSLFITLVVFSGGCYPALNLVSSNIFGLAVFNTGLSTFELSGLSDIRVITTVLTENGPQLLVQMLYSYSISDLTQNTILAFTTSIMSIVASVLNYFINKDKAGQVYDVFYYFELKLKQPKQDLNEDENNYETGSTTGGKKKKKKKKKKLTKRERNVIKVRKGLKLQLASEIVKTYPDVDIAHFCVGYVTIRRDNFVIRMCQHLHEQDLGLTIDDEDFAKYRTKRAKQEAKLRPFKGYCYELYAANREEIENIIYKHFSELNRKRFEMIYHKEYPTDKNVDKILHGDQRSKVFKDLIRDGIGVSADFEEDDEDEDIIDDGDIETGTGTNGTRKSKKKPKKETLTNQHRDDFKEAFELLSGAVHAYQYKRDPEQCVPKSQIHKWRHLLQSNDIHHAAIDDVLDFAITSGLFIKDEKHESDIDSSDESQELFKDDEEFILQQKKIKHARMLNNPMTPEWFVTTNDNTQTEGETEQEGVNTNNTNKKASFWNSFNKAKKEKKENKNKNKNKKENQLRKNIELSTVNKWNGFQDNDDIDGDMETALDEWANE